MIPIVTSHRSGKCQKSQNGEQAKKLRLGHGRMLVGSSLMALDGTVIVPKAARWCGICLPGFHRSFLGIARTPNPSVIDLAEFRWGATTVGGRSQPILFSNRIISEALPPSWAGEAGKRSVIVLKRLFRNELIHMGRMNDRNVIKSK